MLVVKYVNQQQTPRVSSSVRKICYIQLLHVFIYQLEIQPFTSNVKIHLGLGIMYICSKIMRVLSFPHTLNTKMFYRALSSLNTNMVAKLSGVSKH